VLEPFEAETRGGLRKIEKRRLFGVFFKPITRSVKQRPMDVVPQNGVEFSDAREHEFDFGLVFVNRDCITHTHTHNVVD